MQRGVEQSEAWQPVHGRNLARWRTIDLKIADLKIADKVAHTHTPFQRGLARVKRAPTRWTPRHRSFSSFFTLEKI